MTAAGNAGITRFVHMSALGAQPNPALPYLNAKWESEEAVPAVRTRLDHFPAVSDLRAARRLRECAREADTPRRRRSGGRLRHEQFQPIAVGEVAEAFRAALEDPAANGQVYELGGGEIYSYEEMLDVIATQLGMRKRKLTSGRHDAAVVSVSSPLPRSLRPPVTREQLKMLAIDNCTDHSATAT